MRALKLVVFLPFIAACPSTGPSDGGTDAATVDGPLACQPDAGPGKIDPMQATHPPFQNACSMQQIDDYAQCQGAKKTSFCEQFKPGGTGEACGKCIETPFELDAGTDAWGVIVFNGSTASMNVEGCVNDALGTFECGNALYQLYQCEEVVCSACTGSDFATCELESVGDPTYCKSYADIVFAPTGPCAAINGDAGIPCAAQNCFPDTSITDSMTQQVEWLKRIVGYMCGAVPDPNPCP